MQRTLILFKPDAIQRRLCGRLLSRLEERGLKIVGLKMLQVTSELSRQHYAEHVEKPFYPLLEEFITSGPVIALVAEGPSGPGGADHDGEHQWSRSGSGTIRGDYGLSRQMNLMHGSDGPEAAEREIGIYFRPEELVSYGTCLDPWVCADDEK